MARGVEVDEEIITLDGVGENRPSARFTDKDGGKQRFLLELEFVQCLANPAYINYLAQNRYFDNPSFINYLKYLLYWTKPEYAKFIVYPHSLFFLEMLQSKQFRTAIAYPFNKELVHRQQFYFWQHYRNNRLKIWLPQPLPPPEIEKKEAAAVETKPPAVGAEL